MLSKVNQVRVEKIFSSLNKACTRNIFNGPILNCPTYEEMNLTYVDISFTETGVDSTSNCFLYKTKFRGYGSLTKLKSKINVNICKYFRQVKFKAIACLKRPVSCKT